VRAASAPHRLAAKAVVRVVDGALPDAPGGGPRPEPTVCIVERNGHNVCYPPEIVVALIEHCTPVGCDFGFTGAPQP
jgi:hypothetical protein